MPTSASQAELFDRLREVRNEALEHARAAQRLALQRRDLMRTLLDLGVSRSDIARELGVSRQAVQKMLAV
jgi:transposase-like protein